MKNIYIQKTRAVSQFLTEEQITPSCSIGRLAAIVGLVALSIAAGSAHEAIAAEKDQANPSPTISEKNSSGNKVVASSLTVPLESTETEPKPVLQAERKDIIENQITPSTSLKTSLENLQQTRQSLQSSLKALKQEESKLKVDLAAGPIKVSDATQAPTTTTQIALSSETSNQNNINTTTSPTSEGNTSLKTAIVIPVPSPEVQEPETENQNPPQVIPNEVKSPTLVKSTDLEVPLVVSPQEKEDFNKTTIEVTNSQSENLPQIYKVQQGDTLNKIASRYGVSVSQLMKLNRMTNPNLVKLNQELVIPTTTPTPEPQSTIPVVASNRSSNLEAKISNIYASKLKSQVVNLRQTGQSIPVELESRQAQSNYPNEEKLPKPSLVGTASLEPTMDSGSVQIPVDEPSESPWINNPGTPLQNLPPFTGYMWPTKGVITSGYGRRWGRMHKGIDIASSVGTPVVAAATGEVISAGWNSGGYGNLVVIRHANGSITYYGHNSRVLVRTGQLVQKGEQVSAMGSTGRSTGPHLHFEVRPDGLWAVNPIAFLPNSR